MITENDINYVSEKLSELLKTPVSKLILRQVSDKQILHLRRMIENIIKPNYGAFYYQNEEDSRKVIYSILDYGKSKLKPRVHSDKTNHYLKTKFN